MTGKLEAGRARVVLAKPPRKRRDSAVTAASETKTLGRARKVVDGVTQKSTRDKLLDAAEELFAEHGYDGTTLRDIASLAQVLFGLATYYFGTKEELFRQVVARRAEQHQASMMGALDDLLARFAPASPSIEALVEAFFAPLVDKLLNQGPGWRNYLRLLARAANIKQEQDFLQPFQTITDPLRVRFVDIAAGIFPTASREDVLWAAYFFNAALTQFIAGEGSIDRISGGRCRANDLETIGRKMVPYFAGAFRAMIGAGEAARG